MKKSITLTALAAIVSAPVCAQSDISLYGRFNLTLEHQTVNGAKSNTVNNNASRFGLKGGEDLGQGMKAGFQFEHGFDPTKNPALGNTFWDRQSEVNLGGPWGLLRLGLFASEAYLATADWVSMHNHDTGLSADALFAEANGWDWKNRIAYRTPEFHGLVTELAYKMDSATTRRGYDLAANYDRGAFHAGLGYSKQGNAQALALRGLYELGDFTFGGYYQRDKDVWSDTSGAAAVPIPGSRNNFRLSGMYTMGATELHANVGLAGKIGGAADTGAKQYTAGVNYNLSKRTKIYSYYTKLAGDDAAPYGNISALALGLRHNF